MKPAHISPNPTNPRYWLTFTSTEATVGQVVRRRHREQFAHAGRCPYPDCNEHPTPLAELQLTNDKEG